MSRYCCAKLCDEHAVRSWAAGYEGRRQTALGLLARALTGKLQSRDQQMAELASFVSLDIHSAWRAVRTQCLEAKLRKQAYVSSYSNEVRHVAAATAEAGARTPKRRVVAVVKSLAACLPHHKTRQPSVLAVGQATAAEYPGPCTARQAPVRGLQEVCSGFVDGASCTDEEIREWAIHEGPTAPLRLQAIARWIAMPKSDSASDLEVARVLLCALGYDLWTVFASALVDAGLFEISSKQECGEDAIQKWLIVNAGSWPEPSSSFWRDDAFSTFVARVKSTLPSTELPQQEVVSAISLSHAEPNRSMEISMPLTTSTLRLSKSKYRPFSSPPMPTGPFLFPLSFDAAFRTSSTDSLVLATTRMNESVDTALSPARVEKPEAESIRNLHEKTRYLPSFYVKPARLPLRLEAPRHHPLFYVN